MLVLFPKLVNKLKKTAKKFYKRNSQRISRLSKPSKLISFLFLFAILVPISVNADFGHKTYQTTVGLDTKSPTLLTDPVQTVNVPVGLSRDEIEKLGLSHDPQEIKMLIQQIAPQYGLDWRMVYAIGYLESGNFNSSLARRQNNFFGRKASSGTYASWPNTIEAITNQCEYLKTHYLDRGLKTPQEMNRVYAEGNTWGTKVQSIINSL